MLLCHRLIEIEIQFEIKFEIEIQFEIQSGSGSGSGSTWLGCYKNMRELRNCNDLNLDCLTLVDLYLIPIWLIYEIDQSGSSWSELDQ